MRRKKKIPDNLASPNEKFVPHLTDTSTHLEGNHFPAANYKSNKIFIFTENKQNKIIS